jgi:hypothetical protein
MQAPEPTARTPIETVIDAWPVLAATAAFSVIAGVLLY